LIHPHTHPTHPYYIESFEFYPIRKVNFSPPRKEDKSVDTLPPSELIKRSKGVDTVTPSEIPQ